GHWGSDSVTNRLAARFELIDLLASEGARSELLAELLPLESRPVDSSALLVRLAPLYLIAGSPARAEEAYRQLSRRTPANVAAYAGLGEVALSEGQFEAARTAFANAARLRPSDSAVALRLRLVDTLRALDPNARQLSDAARVNRSRALLRRALQSLDSCAPLVATTDGALRDSTRAVLADAKQYRDAAASVDRLLTLATSLWRTRTTACDSGSSESDEVLKRLLGS
ncbi:MAG: hypothetical protein JWL61_4289, partial [Gemmatimonadetes bacterium]|nr:hypothetical protein [Gemmatimonadota bacterium]